MSAEPVQPDVPAGPEQPESIPVEEIYADLAGLAEVAEGLGVSVYRVRRWIERRASTQCPEPVKVLKFGHIYSMGDWRGWFALWRITRGSETWLRKTGEVPDAD